MPPESQPRRGQQNDDQPYRAQPVGETHQYRGQPPSSQQLPAQHQAIQSQQQPNAVRPFLATFKTYKSESIRKYFTILRHIGQGHGSFNQGIAIVKRADIASNDLWVEKQIPQADLEIGMREINILKILCMFKHPNIIRCNAAYVLEKECCLYLEYCDLGDLHSLKRNYIKQVEDPKYIPEDFIWHVLRSLTEALIFLQMGIIDIRERQREVSWWQQVRHRDIKPHNIFLVSPQNPGEYPRVVLGDFGLATRTDLADWDDRGCGTNVWRPPEWKHTWKSEVWSIAAVAYSLCHQNQGPVDQSTLPNGVSWNDWSMAPAARQIQELPRYYSSELNDVVVKYAMALNGDDRPHPRYLFEIIQNTHESALKRRFFPPLKPLHDFAFNGIPKPPSQAK